MVGTVLSSGRWYFKIDKNMSFLKPEPILLWFLWYLEQSKDTISEWKRYLLSSYRSLSVKKKTAKQENNKNKEYFDRKKSDAFPLGLYPECSSFPLSLHSEPWVSVSELLLTSLNYWCNWQPYTLDYMLSSFTEENICFNHNRCGILVTLKAKVLYQRHFHKPMVIWDIVYFSLI